MSEIDDLLLQEAEALEKATELRESVLALEKEVKDLETKHELLTEESQASRKALHRTWYETAQKRFKDFVVRNALLGLPAIHEVTIAGGMYHLASPSQQIVVDVEQWARKTETIVTATEIILLQWLIAVGGTGDDGVELQSLIDLEVPIRILTLRKMPATLFGPLSDLAQELQGYLNLAVGHELGNF